MLSVYFRSTLMQVMVPSGMLGRVSAVNQIFIGSSNELGAFESGVAARLLGAVPSVVVGGAITVASALVTNRVFPSLARLDSFARLRGRRRTEPPTPIEPIRKIRHPHRLDVHELAQAVDAQLAPVARALDAPEREALVGRDHAVDEDAAGFELARQPLRLAAIARPRRRAQAERRARWRARSPRRRPAARKTAATGPNTSSRAAGASGGTSARTVGG